MPDSNATTNATRSVQDSSAYLFVPYTAGQSDITSDDARKPGAYFRLGGYSGIELAAKASDPSQPDAANNLSSFYPRQHLSDEAGADPVENAVGPRNSTYRGGIMLACDGRMLMRSGEKLYVHSKSDVHIDTEGKLTVVAVGDVNISTDATMEIRTRNTNAITISADGGNGDVTVEAKKETRRVSGNSYEYVTQNKYTYTQANTVDYKLGRFETVTLGGNLSFFMGSSMVVNLSVDMAINLNFAINLYLGQFSMGLKAFDFCAYKTEFTDGAIKTGGFHTDNFGAAVKTSLAEAGNSIVTSGSSAIASMSSGLSSMRQGVSSNLSSLRSYVSGLSIFS